MGMKVTTFDVGTVQVRGCKFRDDVITFAGADDLAEGTIMARDSVSQKLRLFVKGGSTNGNGVPKVVLGQRVVATVAGDVPCRAIVGGELNKQRLVIDADGNSSNVDAAVLDQLRAVGIVAHDVAQLGRVDG
jgi:Bacteriophage lambda head decoration protein D